MSAASLASYLYYSRISHPSHERVIYRWIKRRKATRLVELGLGQGVRSSRMIQVAQRYAEGRRVHYTGIDLFEAREAGESGMTLKRAFLLLRPRDIHLRLVPGDAFSALSRCANYLAGSDVVFISADQDWAAMDRAWAFLPRMLHEQSVVFCEGRAETGHEPLVLDPRQVQALAGRAMRSRRMAA